MPAKSMSPEMNIAIGDYLLASYTNPSIADNGTRKEPSFLQTNTLGTDMLEILSILYTHYYDIFQEYGNIRNPA